VVTESSLNLKDVINILERETLPRKKRSYVNEEVEFEDGTRIKGKDEFECWLRWQKVPLYPIEALEFLDFAKKDLEEGSDRGRVNALRNAKSAIECRIDELLALSNLRGFSSRKGWKLPYKIEVLKTLQIPAPKVLRNLITQKRNLLEHEYVRPKEQEEIQNIVDVAELFLKATDQYVEKGYISSATITCTVWFEIKGVDAWHGTSDEYKLAFNLEGEALTVTHSEKELILDPLSELESKNRSLKEWQIGPQERKEVINLPIRDCVMEDVRELMILLRKKGSELLGVHSEKGELHERL